MNAKTKNARGGEDLPDLGCLAEFADLYANALPGFFSLSSYRR